MNLLVPALLWAAVLLSTTGLALGLARSRRTPGGTHPGPLRELSEAAFLSGGPRRVVDTAVVGLCLDGRMMTGGPGAVQVRSGARAADPAERLLLSLYSSGPGGSLDLLRGLAMTDPVVQETGDGLAARGLLTAPGSTAGPRRWATAQIVCCLLAVPVLFVLVIVRAATADPLEGPSASGFLAFFLSAPAVFAGFVAGAVLRVASVRRITPAGRRALAAYRAAHAGSTDPRVLIALQGPRGVADPLLRAQLLRQPLRTSAGGRTGAAAHRSSDHDSCGSTVPEVLWCAGGSGGGGGGCGGGSGCGSSGGSCGSSGSNCGSSSSSCGSSGSSGTSSCGSSSGSSCGSSGS
ncbi:TIGR04222 domain-containing membrane protein [Streptomyces sp. NPDC097619]|uniref:TIGR04222 domain-containing membrane protein n=1 Tax=Streptomyces sp. NPDC097619 TaxID=3157228 RepID=UPI0033264169